MKDRIKQLRKYFKLNQTAFGEKIGVNQSTITGYETGAREPLNNTILSICREFNVNEEWLRSGTGEMFQTLTPQEELMKYSALLLKENNTQAAKLIKNIIITYGQLDNTSKECLELIISKYIENLKKD